METATTNASGTVSEKRKPVFKKVDNLKPGTNGHTLTVKVVSSKTVKVGNKGTGRSSAMLMARPSQPSRIAECLVGDETGTILFTARNEQGKINDFAFVQLCFWIFFFQFFIHFIYFILSSLWDFRIKSNYLFI